MTHGLKNKKEVDGFSTAMRLLIHYVGDVHQPLHATSRFNKDYPSGDRGGNSFHIPSKFGAKNLHSFWDSVAYEFTGRDRLPLKDSAYTQLEKYAK